MQENQITIRFDDAEAIYVGLLKEMRQIVLQAVDALPQRLNPTDPQLAREGLQELVHHVFMRQMHGQVDRSGADRAALDDDAPPAQKRQ